MSKLTVKSSELAWSSDDGKVKIYKVTDQDGVLHETMSGKIAAAIGQTFEIESYTNAKGKTYIRQPRRDDVPKAPPASPSETAVRERSYRADSDKLAIMRDELKQDMTLEAAKNMSIQRQVAVKGAVDLIVASKRSYDELHGTYVHLMELLSERDWTRFAAASTSGVDDQPPIEAYNEAEGESDVDLDNFDISDALSSLDVGDGK